MQFTNQSGYEKMRKHMIKQKLILPEHLPTCYMIFKNLCPVVNEFEVTPEDIPTEELDEPETLKRKSKVLNDVKLKENSIVGSYYIKKLRKDSNCKSNETAGTAESKNDIVVAAKIEGT